jgi:LysM repeat protein
MMKKYLFPGLMLTASLFFLSIFPVQAGSIDPQVVYATPTPNSDGRIIYVVKASDNCISISYMTGVPLDELKRLNNLKDDCALQEGQQLLLGIAEKSAVQATATPANQVPTPTLEPGSGQICVLLFNDINGNAVPDGGELPLAGGAISVTDRDGKVSLTNQTDAKASVCFKDLLEGEYNISVAIPEGYNATSVLNVPLKLNGGDNSTLDFGAQVSSKAVEPATGGKGDQSRSPILGIVGVALLLGGIGLGVYVARMGRRR